MILIQSFIILAVSLMIFYPLTKYTSTGRMMGNITYWFDNIKVQDMIRRLSYSKIFVCRPCHTFWMTVGLCLQNVLFMAFPIQLMLPQCFITYLIVSIIDKKNKRNDKG